MANLLDFYKPASGTPGGFLQESFNSSAGNATEDAGLSMERQKRQYETRTLPGLANSYAARGTFYSGQFGQAADRAKEDYVAQSGDVQRLLNRHLADLTRQRLLASMGVAL